MPHQTNPAYVQWSRGPKRSTRWRLWAAEHGHSPRWESADPLTGVYLTMGEIGESTELVRLNFVKLMRAAMDAFANQATVDALITRVAELERKVNTLSSAAERKVEAAAEAQASLSRFADELLELIGEGGAHR